VPHELDLTTDGCTILPGVLSAARCAAMAEEIQNEFLGQAVNAIENRGNLVGGRNLMLQWNGWRELTNLPDVFQWIRTHVGPDAGLVRILYFDKPPGQSWSLPLHRDQTIAVTEHHQPPTPFSRPTRKAGVPHVVASEELLKQMLTLRLHLDSMCPENGPLVVAKGSHLDTAMTCSEAVTAVHCQAGDLFLMRPLLLHGSLAATPETKLHRRVLHLEIGPSVTLPAPYQWHCFQRISS
jgi:Phytanoyl-CoA dioxygenase (PhyH)